MLVQALLPGPVTKWLGGRKVDVAGFAAASTALIAMAFSNRDWIVFAIMPIFFRPVASVPASAMSLASIVALLAFSTIYFVVQKRWPGAIWLSVVVLDAIASPS